MSAGDIRLVVVGVMLVDLVIGRLVSGSRFRAPAMRP